ncbi:hypothetical protein DFH06DRAFT_710312 [Mycena polygramma]|nr:hypothetical protein DFH06DRAFT_710312 [Mycena polygramma]
MSMLSSRAPRPRAAAAARVGTVKMRAVPLPAARNVAAAAPKHCGGADYSAISSLTLAGDVWEREQWRDRVCQRKRRWRGVARGDSIERTEGTEQREEFAQEVEGNGQWERDGAKNRPMGARCVLLVEYVPRFGPDANSADAAPKPIFILRSRPQLPPRRSSVHRYRTCTRPSGEAANSAAAFLRSKIAFIASKPDCLFPVQMFGGGDFGRQHCRPLTNAHPKLLWANPPASLRSSFPPTQDRRFRPPCPLRLRALPRKPMAETAPSSDSQV